ncbi:uncharacterized protein LOC105215498 isoform X2 [Zeugodacus cucurbitae]|uniref:uncharacterized protein LOC105215498 isoform X2 n=1 Tax=Zeugodacus cucurbitae TaxID=28588 RepID=UPI0005968523|nr:uncharacterized protein LOC105215498 isoform X2 [Zeugodacus cucurbitae]
MELRPLRYKEMCQLEILQRSALSGTSTSAVLPIVMIEPSIVTPSSSILKTPRNNDYKEVTDNENIYQFQPSDIFVSNATTSDQMAQHELHIPGLYSGGKKLLQAEAISLPNIEQHHQNFPNDSFRQQLPQAHKQIPQIQIQQTLPAALNIIYTGTINTSPQIRDVPESSNISRAFSDAIANNNVVGVADNTGDDSDFEGSECGMSVSGATCIPHFHFGGCGMILQPTLTANNCGVNDHRPHPYQQHRPKEPEDVGCVAFSHMMGTFASAAGGAMNSTRFTGAIGSLTGIGSGVSTTLGRNRRTPTCQYGSTHQNPKRVSFKEDNIPNDREKLSEENQNNCDYYSHGDNDALHNCSYMYLKNITNCQTIGFGGLPDVTEHSNTRRTHSRQNSTSNSDSGGEIVNIDKSKVSLCDGKPPPTAQSAHIEGKSKISRHSAAVKCSRTHRLKPRCGSCAIFLTFVATICLLTIATLLAYQHFMVHSRNSHAQRLKIVQRILKDVPLVDGHNNFAWNVRKYAHNSLELMNLRHDPNAETRTPPSWAQTDVERLKQGLVGVQMWSAYVPCEALGLDAVQVAIEQIDIIRRLTDMYTLDTVLVKSSKDIFTARQHHQMASLIGIKGGHAIGSSLAVLRSFYSVGARALSLTHKCDLSWAGSSASESENGLSAFGKAVIREMNRLGMMVDLSYSSTATARDVLQVTRAPVIFSHSAARQICNSTHNVPDDILRLVADNGGLIMVSFDPEDVACGQPAYLADVVKHIKHIRAIAGVQHIGLGAGYDDIEEPPIGLEDVSKYPDLLATLLQDHNWSEQDIAMLAGKNFLRILETVENVRDYWKRADIQPLEQTEPQPKPQCSYMSS